jgi:uncharacterized protein (DUF433 family)
VFSERLTEAEKMRRVPGIVFAGGPHGRRACVAGSGFDVVDIIRAYRDCGEDRTQFYQQFEAVDEETLSAAFHYYRAFPEEIDAALASSSGTEGTLPRGQAGEMP